MTAVPPKQSSAKWIIIACAAPIVVLGAIGVAVLYSQHRDQVAVQERIDKLKSLIDDSESAAAKAEYERATTLLAQAGALISANSALEEGDIRDTIERLTSEYKASAEEAQQKRELAAKRKREAEAAAIAEADAEKARVEAQAAARAKADVERAEKDAKEKERVAAAAQKAQGEAEAKRRVDQETAQLFELKGDRMRMSLDEFKHKYRRKVDTDTYAPFCSDANPNQANPMLFYEAIYAKANVVCASTYYPFEQYQGRGPTIADVPADTYIYKFVDRELYEIVIFFKSSQFRTVLPSLKNKYGEPTTTDVHTYSNAYGATFDGLEVIWSNDSCEMTLSEIAGSRDASSLILIHKQLAQIADDRITSLEAKKGAGDL